VRDNVTVTTRTATARAARIDQVCADAVGVARGAITDVDPSDVGDHLEAVAEGDRVVTHFFDSHLAGYKGWRWAVTVTRVPRSRHVTICETVLLPGPDALLAPAWLPWNERVQAGDLGIGDLMATAPDDDRLAPGYVLSDDPAVEEVSWELGLGRSRVMSQDGRMEAAQRWYEGDSGPEAPISTAAPRNARCGTCGFYLPLAGSLRLSLGACANVFSPADGHVVTADYGCGAHSQANLERTDGEPAEVQLTARYDTADFDVI
jgi:hypothetical protein